MDVPSPDAYIKRKKQAYNFYKLGMELYLKRYFAEAYS
jgi:hypothetical protein